jgi:hypothetical protein
LFQLYQIYVQLFHLLHFEGKQIFEDFINQINETSDVYMIDQKFLYHCIYPFVVLNSFIHTSHNKYEPFAQYFPETSYKGFVCEVITDTPNASKIFNDEQTSFDRIGQY